MSDWRGTIGSVNQIVLGIFLILFCLAGLVGLPIPDWFILSVGLLAGVLLLVGR